MKNKMLAIMLVVCVAMTATTFGHNWDGSEDPNLWSIGANWDENSVPTGSVYIGNGDTVVLDYAPASLGRLEIYGGSTLLIEAVTNISQSTSQDSYLGGAAGKTGAGTIIQTGGYFKHGDDLKCTDGGPATYIMQGGTSIVPGYIEVDSDCLFEFSGGRFTNTEDGDPVESPSGGGATFRVLGSWTMAGADPLIQFSGIGVSVNYEFIPTADGEITPITSGSTSAGSLLVDANDITATGIITMTLFTGGSVGAFANANVTITKDGTPLTEDTDGAPLGLNEYTLDYLSGAGLALSVNLPSADAFCDLAKTGGYTAEMARVKGDTNNDCKVNLDDVAAMALNWLTVKSL